VSVSGSEAPAALIKTASRDENGVVSPDGKGIAFNSNASDGSQVYVRPYPDVAAGQWQVSTAGGSHPRWSRDSRELFFVTNDAVMGTRVSAGAAWAASVPEVVV
jgi:Tol biopolymer transport system component